MPVSEVVLVLMALLGVGVVASGLSKRLPLPYTVLLVLIGMGLKQAAPHVDTLHALQQLTLTPELVFFVFLPTLVFESGFSLDVRQLMKDIAPVLTMAIPALLLSTTVVGLGLWAISPLNLGEALLFGTLISATDPVAVVSLFKELGTPKRLMVLVEGESLMNDATAIVVFGILVGIVQSGTFDAAQLPSSVLVFVKVFFGGALVGLVFGAVALALLAVFKIHLHAVMLLSMVLAYVAFIVAEHNLHVSGVMAAIVAAMTLRLLGMPRLPKAASSLLHETWEYLGLVANTLLFLLIGLSVDAGSMLAMLGLVLGAVLLVQGGRAGVLYSLVPLTTRVFRLPTVSMSERHIMWWGGLKGGLAIAMVLSIPQTLPARQLLVDITAGVVLFSLLVNASTIAPLMRKLGMQALTDDEHVELHKAAHHTHAQADEVLHLLHDVGVLDDDDVSDLTAHLQPTFVPPPAPSAHTTQRTLHLLAMRAELQQLDDALHAGLVSQGDHLDLKGELQRKADRVARDASPTHLKHWQTSPFAKAEEALLQQVREVDAATPLLARLQQRRFAHAIAKDVVRLLMCGGALQALHDEEADDDGDAQQPRDVVVEHYRNRMRSCLTRIQQARQTRPAFFHRSVRALSTRAALVSALRSLDHLLHTGHLSAKPYRQMEKALASALHAAPVDDTPAAGVDLVDLARRTPVFAGVDDARLQQLLQEAAILQFLPGDVVIGADEAGAALYVVVRGELQVFRDDVDDAIATVGPNDVVGEQALLHDQPRSATVRCTTTCSLLRIPGKDVQALLHDDADVQAKLRTIAEGRLPTS